jgi:four helix bundle protein
LIIDDFSSAICRRLDMDADEMKHRTKQFAHRCIKLALALPNTPLGNHVRRQLVRCSTSVAANYRATCLAQSKSHFASKLSTVAEETDESAFWMEFSVEEGMLSEQRVAPLLTEAHELTSIFVSGRKTAKDRSPEFNNP